MKTTRHEHDTMSEAKDRPMRLSSIARFGLIGALAVPVAACGGLNDRLSQVGQAPALSAIENPTAAAGYRPVQLPMPAPEAIHREPSSLWRTGSRAFFKDQRARVIGDILTVRVRVADRANIDNQTKRTRENSENLGVDNFLGVEDSIGDVLAGADPKALVGAKSGSNSKGSGSVRRNEQIQTDIAAIVTQVLPNGNLVIEGKQEVRVNFEVRELIVAGVIRPEDIEAGNQIDSTKIAQARIAYGGRGQITDVQQPRYGQQVLDVVLPF
jgi:flagellar L-ring protein FlgH